MKKSIRLTISNQVYEGAVSPNQTLVEALREPPGLTGIKVGCNEGDRGAFAVIMDGDPVNSCLVLALRADGSRIQTIDGLEEEKTVRIPFSARL